MEKNCISINKGDVLVEKDTNNRYRVLCTQHEYVTLCKMDIDKLDIHISSFTQLIEQLQNEEIYKEAPDDAVYDYDLLTDKQKAAYHFKKDILDRVVNAYSLDFLSLMGKETKPVINEILSEGHIGKTALWDNIRKYLQSGFNIYTVINIRNHSYCGYGTYNYSKKPGRPSPHGLSMGIPYSSEVIEHFRTALNEFKKGRNMTYEKAYRWMLTRYYSFTEETPDGLSITLLPATERPTFNQFCYFMKNNLSQKERDIIKTSAMEVRNNKRLLLSDVMYGVMGPCDRVQMDECEADVSLVAETNPDQSVGRPIVYVMIDVYTRMILAVGISYDNNSVLGMTNCLINLAEDKVEYCAKYGITITQNQWPSGYLPHRILSDRGAEYMSKEAKRICNELNITLEPVPAGTGSLKGSVEQWFHQLQTNQNAALEHNGQISKRHDSKHHKESCLTIDEFTKMLLNFVIFHNTHVLENYPPEPDMIRENIPLVPASLWKYGCKKYGTPNVIQNIHQYYYSLMLPQNATLDRRGIKCNGLYYLKTDDSDLYTKMYELQDKKEKINVRIDPRDIGSVYYLKDNKLVQVPLNHMRFGNVGFAGLSLNEWTTIRKSLQKQKIENKITKEAHRIYLDTVIETIVASAKKNYPSSTADMTKNRNFEKYYLQNRNSMYIHLTKKLEQDLSIPITAPIDEFSISDDIIIEIEETNALQEAINTTSEFTDEDWLQAIENCNNQTYNTTNS